MEAPRCLGSAAMVSRVSEAALKQDVVNLFRVLKRQAADLLRKREHDVEIGDGQKLRLPLRRATWRGPWPGTWGNCDCDTS